MVERSNDSSAIAGVSDHRWDDTDCHDIPRDNTNGDHRDEPSASNAPLKCAVHVKACKSAQRQNRATRVAHRAHIGN
jgi:hypothetical protein